MTRLTHLNSALDELGLIARGSFHPTAADGVPALGDGTAVRTVVIVGNAGKALWPVFKPFNATSVGPDPMNRWTREVMMKLAEELHAGVWFPFQGPPYLPFQRWAQRADRVWSSPIGILIHGEYGLWHAYRAALGFAEDLQITASPEAEMPCLSCIDQPCLSTCPVEAFGADGYAVDSCRQHIATDAGQDCLQQGCRARRACPVGTAFRYNADHANFHMSAFLAAGARSTVG